MCETTTNNKKIICVSIMCMHMTSGIGAIIRNDRGEVMASLSTKGPPMACSEEAEILACRHAVEFALECGFTKLVLKGDIIKLS